MKVVKPGRYQHYKGKFYQVIGVAHHSETLEELVVYRALYNRFAKTVETSTDVGEGRFQDSVVHELRSA